VVSAGQSTRQVGNRGWRPGPEQEQLLLAARSHPSETADAWLRLTCSVDIEELDASSQDLLPLIYRALEAAGVKDPWLGRLKGTYRRTWYGNQLLLRRLSEALAQLNSHGIDAVVVGGAAVGLLHYRALGARPMGDSRIAVRPAQAGQARVALSGVELDSLALTSADDDLWRARVPLEVAGASAYAPCSTDQLLCACADRITGSGPRCGRWAMDVLAILDSSAEEIDWRRLVRRGTEARLIPGLGLMLSYLRERFSAPVSPAVIDTLRVAAPPPAAPPAVAGRCP
jgi:hypothetical protein